MGEGKTGAFAQAVSSRQRSGSSVTGRMRSTAFIPKEYWSLEADVLCEGEKKPMRIKFYGTKNQKVTIEKKEELERILEKTKNEPFEISEIKRGERVKKAAASVHNQYASAGSSQRTEFFNPEDYAPGSAAL